MSGPALSGAVEQARAAVAHRWRAVDHLLPEPTEPVKSCGAELTVLAADGHVVAAGLCRHVHLRPGSLNLAWGAAHQFALTAWIAGPEVGEGLSQLLERWRRHLGLQPEGADPDSSATVAWPSRDVEGIRALLEHELRPLTVIAARPARRALAGGAGGAGNAGPGDLRIRAVGQGDLDALERLGMEVLRYDAHFGAVTVRPDTTQALREWAAETLAAAQPWTWLAERDGEAVGMVQAEPPKAAGWIAPMVRAEPVAYLGEMSVLPDARGSGVGTALVEHLHRELDAAGAAVTLLHHAQLNPLSAPFWNRMGYRPLWTSWEIRPAARLR